MSSDHTKPLPCPFCSAAPYPKDPIIGNPEVLRDGIMIFVNCFRCGAKGPSSIFTVERSLMDCETEALQLWNRRAQIETSAVKQGDTQ